MLRLELAMEQTSLTRASGTVRGVFEDIRQASAAAVASPSNSFVLARQLPAVVPSGHPGVGSVLCLGTQSCPTLCEPHRPQPVRLLCLWNSPGKNTGVGSHSLLQGIFLTWARSPNLSLLHYRWILYHLSTREVLMSLYCPSFIIILNIFSAYI